MIYKKLVYAIHLQHIGYQYTEELLQLDQCQRQPAYTLLHQLTINSLPLE